MKKRLIATFILIAYGAILIKVMVFKDLPLIRMGRLRLNFGGSQEGPANLIPFKTILPYLLGEKGFLIAAINLLGNVVLLVPIGFLVPFVHRNMTWKKSLALAAGAGFFIEGMQEILRVGIFDIDDVILNGLGVMVGYWTFTILANKVRSIRAKNIIIITSVMVIAAVAAVYGVAVYQKSQRPVNFRPGAENNQSNHINHRYDTSEQALNSSSAASCGVLYLPPSAGLFD